MGNRAHIIFPKARVAIYLHWNGGLESVVTFLDYASEIGMGDDSYGAARLCQIIGNYFGGTLSLGVEGYSPGPAALRTLSTGHDPAYQVARGVDGKLHVVGMGYDGKTLTSEDLAARIERARIHHYNVKGEMLDEVRARNAFSRKEA